MKEAANKTAITTKQFDVTDNVALLTLGVLLVLLDTVVVFAAVQDRPNAMQILPILTGLTGTVIGYIVGTNQGNSGPLAPATP